MQDGAPPHTSKKSLRWLTANFNSVSQASKLKTDFAWAPYSPDLNPLDFFLWGYLKDSVYRNYPTSLGELKDAITHHIQKVNDDKILCKKVIENFKKRINLCVERNGQHLEHILKNIK